MTLDVNPHAIDQHAKAHYLAAQAHLSARTIVELQRRRIAACARNDTRRAPRWMGWPLATALGSAFAFALTLALLIDFHLPPTTPVDIPETVAELDAADALDSINLTALDEDSEFFLWLAAHEASLLAME